MPRFFCIGDVDTCSGFALAGVECAVPESADDAVTAFDRVRQDPEIAVLIITEEVASRLQERIIDHRVLGVRPMIVEIPGNLSEDFRGGSLMDSIRQAVGISI